jgi:inhibitor of the pro-sigma K processing machinery
MEWKAVVAWLAGLAGLYLVGTVLFHPFRFLLRLALYLVFGGAIVLAANAVIGQFGFHIPVNALTVLTAGLLQLPGLVLLVLVSCWL